MIGKWVRWSGTVTDVRRAPPTSAWGFTVTVMQPARNFKDDTWLLTLHVPKSELPRIELLREDDEIDFEGRVQRLSGHPNLEDAVITAHRIKQKSDKTA